MKKVFLITLIVALFTTSGTFAQKTGTLTDKRDGHVYKTVKIGEQWWMAENLAYKTSSGCWAYDNNKNNISKYGYLYNWKIAEKSCPNGWHLSSVTEWGKLINFLGNSKIVGGMLKAKINWKQPNTGATNSSGFSALPGGMRYDSGSYSNFKAIEEVGWWWAAPVNGSPFCKKAVIGYKDASVNAQGANKSDGFSVRCVKD